MHACCTRGHPNPPLSDVTTALDDLEKAFALVQAARSEVTTKTVSQDNAEAKLDQTLVPTAPQGLSATAGEHESNLSDAGQEGTGR